MSDIYLSVDVGGSQTKIIYQIPAAQEPRFLVMPPAVEEIPKAKLDNYMSRLGGLVVLAFKFFHSSLRSLSNSVINLSNASLIRSLVSALLATFHPWRTLSRTA